MISLDNIKKIYINYHFMNLIDKDNFNNQIMYEDYTDKEINLLLNKIRKEFTTIHNPILSCHNGDIILTGCIYERTNKNE